MDDEFLHLNNPSLGALSDESHARFAKRRLILHGCRKSSIEKREISMTTAQICRIKNGVDFGYDRRPLHLMNEPKRNKDFL
jgi:hypothetical protein